MTPTTPSTVFAARRTWLPALALLCFGFLAAAPSSQEVGRLKVRVTDTSGPLPGAVVTLEHAEGWIAPISRHTGSDGTALFEALRAGKGYVVEVSFPAHQTRRVPDVEIVPGKTEQLEVALGETVTERVRVEAAAPQVVTLSTANSNAVSAETRRQGPGRSYKAVVSGGVSSSSGGPILAGAPTPMPPPPTTAGFDNLAQEEASDTESYDHVRPNPFHEVARQPLSTFSIDVDTASYANVRRFLEQGRMPPPGAVRVEEMINYFRYDYPPPTDGAPFAVDVEVAEAPWAPDHRLARIGIKGREVPAEERPPSNLVFLIDVSGSMNQPNKLPLVQRAMRMLAETLGGRDRVAIVVYAGAAGLVLPSTSGADAAAIVDAVERLRAGGSTAGGAGLRLAYETARAAFIAGGVNRVILATDGDFNVGISDQSRLVELIREEARSGVFLTVLGFGMGNYKDSTLEKLADEGNGNYAYIDGPGEARKVLVEEAGSTLVTIAKDVKIQVEFNPAEVSAYRLIGYENRALRDQDFNDDTKDAGEIGAGHTVTALYELVPAGTPIELPDIDPLEYQTSRLADAAAKSGELFTVKLRYKEPDGQRSTLIRRAVRDTGLRLASAGNDLRFAAAVAAFAMQLRDAEALPGLDGERIIALAGSGIGRDAAGRRAAFLDLVRRAETLRATPISAAPGPDR